VLCCAVLCCAVVWFDQVCVGATVPTDKMHLLLPLLEPEGGKLLAPVEHDLRLYTRTADGKLRQRLVSSVRFSDLEVTTVNMTLFLQLVCKYSSSSFRCTYCAWAAAC